MKNIWNFENIIDLEYFSNIDQFQEGLLAEDFHQRDRRYLLKARQQGELQTDSHAQCLAIWLDNRRLDEANETYSFIPGKMLDDSLQLFRWILLVCGLILGAALGLSYVVYTGKTPLNVFSFFTIFIVPQLGLICLYFLRTFLKRLIKRPRSQMRGMLEPLFYRFVNFVEKRSLCHLKEVQQKSFKMLFSDKIIKIFTRSLFVQAQLFGIAFNIGLLLIMLLKITTSDLAFGWQTTLQLGAEGLNSIVQMVALPWSWLLPVEIVSPSLAQIEGSRIILKEGIYHLATEDLTSWWPFLLLSMTCYGLFPRVLLLSLGLFAERGNYRRAIDQRKFHTISRRMLTPIVSSQASAEVRSGAPLTAEQKDDAELNSKEKESVEKCVVLIPDELYDIIDPEDLDQLLSSKGFQAREKKHLFTSYEEDQRLLEQLCEEKAGVVVLVEAWMPPIQENLLFLKNLSQRLDRKTGLAVCLLGKPGSSGVIVQPDREAIKLWREKLHHYCDLEMIFMSERPVEGSEVQG